MFNVKPIRPPTTWRLSVLSSIGGSRLVGLVVLAFLWPTATASAHDLPVAITGTAAQTQAVEDAIDPASAGVVDFHTAADRATAITSIQERETYGAVVLGERLEVLVASANNPTATELMNTILQGPLLVNALALGVSMVGTASLMVRLTALMGPRGIPVGAVITMLIGNPIAGVTQPY